jgi:hypothetical protein
MDVGGALCGKVPHKVDHFGLTLNPPAWCGISRRSGPVCVVRRTSRQVWASTLETAAYRGIRPSRR